MAGATTTGRRQNGGGMEREKSPRRSHHSSASRRRDERAAPGNHHHHNGTLPRTRHDILHGGHGGHSVLHHGHREAPRKDGLRGKIPVRSEGESGRTGIHPLHFFRIIWRSTSWLSRAVNVLWPVVPAAIAVYFAVPESHLLKFILAYIAIVPCANLVGFAGQELARKMPHMLGVLTETTLASAVEIILFMMLLAQDRFILIQGAILGSILATMLLCLGLCFFAAGMRRDEATFDEAITEAGSGLLLTAGIGLAVPSIFERSVSGTAGLDPRVLEQSVLNISHAVAVLLLIAYVVFVWFQTKTHDGIFNAIFEHDEHRDHDREKDIMKDKLTLTECVVALIISVGLVALLAYILVQMIEPLIEKHGVTDPFMGLILVPLVEKAAEHLTAIDEAWDNQMNFALSHCLGATLQTALLNGPLVVIVGWGLGKPMSLDFQIFDMAMLILSIIAVGNFLRDQKSNYLEGFLCVVLYVAIAVTAFYFPNVHAAASGGDGAGSGEAGGH
ncbi:Ca2+/H+ antiporter [Apiospora rasikravindrae]|uniref:Vacuolar calcium ion transporter n=1 Tax=Apiospora rasikravindrae TaxID=990691 RepID=A0ABR1TZB9_9PEZI